MVILIKNQIVLVDDEYSYLFERYNYWIVYGYHSNIPYVVRSEAVDKYKTKTVYIHHDIVGKPPKGYEVDHADHDGCNNLLSNLRFATFAQNKANNRKIASNGYKGLTWENGKWRVRVGKVHVGRFSDKVEAARAYDKVAKEIYGEYANTNF